MIRERHPRVADHMLVSLSQGRGGFHLEAAHESRDRLLPAIRHVVPRIEQSQMSTVVDSDEEPLLPREVRSQFQSEASPGHMEVRTPPTRATQLEDVTNSLGTALGLDSLPTSVSDVDHEAISDHGDSTFLDNFERDQGVVCPVVNIHGERPHGGAVVPASAGIGYNGRFAVLAEE